MTKKDYTLIALALKDSLTETQIDPINATERAVGVNIAAKQLSKVLKLANPLFNPEKFLAVVNGK